MSKKKTVTLISSVLIVCAVLIQAIVMLRSNGWCDFAQVSGFVVLFLGAVASIASLRIPSSYTRHFMPNDWDCDNNVWLVIILARKHGMGKNPTVDVKIKESNGNYSEIEVFKETNEKGDVHVKAGAQIDEEVMVIIS